MTTSKTIFVYFCAALSFTHFYVEGSDGPAVGKEFEMEGYYKLESDPDKNNLKNVLEATGVPEMIVKAVLATKKLLVSFKKVNTTHFSIIKIAKPISIDFTFQSGNEFEAVLPDGRQAKNVIFVDEEEHTVSRVIKVGGHEAYCTSQFSEKGIETTMTAMDAKVTIRFRRCEEQPRDADDLEELKKKYFAD